MQLFKYFFKINKLKGGDADQLNQIYKIYLKQLNKAKIIVDCYLRSISEAGIRTRGRSDLSDIEAHSRNPGYSATIVSDHKS